MIMTTHRYHTSEIYLLVHGNTIMSVLTDITRSHSVTLLNPPPVTSSGHPHLRVWTNVVLETLVTPLQYNPHNHKISGCGSTGQREESWMQIFFICSVGRNPPFSFFASLCSTPVITWCSCLMLVGGCDLPGCLTNSCLFPLHIPGGMLQVPCKPDGRCKRRYVPLQRRVV